MAAYRAVEPASEADVGKPTEMARRSADYPPSSWSNEFIQSLNSDVPETYTTRHQELMVKIKSMLSEVREPIYLLDLVDTLQKLGVDYHFKDYIDGILDFIFNELTDLQKNGDLYHVSTLFRVLRDHGYEVSQDLFKKFRNEDNHLDYGKCNNIDDILSLYEASFLSHETETLLENDRKFATLYLHDIEENTKVSTLKEKIRHSLEIPFHRRMKRLEARFFINTNANEKKINSLLLEFAQLDYNVVQAMHIDEIKRISRWWNNMGFVNNLHFFRDRVIEAWVWALGIASYEPQFSYCRERLTQLILLLTVLDDFYDVYGTMDEIELFTNALERWNIHELQMLPHYLKTIFLALYNFVNTTSYEILRDKKIDITLHLKRKVFLMLKAYYVEAKWSHTQYIPSYKEYIDNAVLSVGSPTLLGILYLLGSENLTNETIEEWEEIPILIWQTGIIGRLLDDEAGSQNEIGRGDVHKAIECYSHHEKVTNAVARDYVIDVIESTWRSMNREKYANPILPKFIVDAAFNFSRICHFYYQRGDAYSSPDSFMKEYISQLLIKNIPIEREN